MFSPTIESYIDALDRGNLRAIALMGSYARGAAGKYSDIDVVCFLAPDAPEAPPQIKMVDNKYMVISFVPAAETRSWFSEPEKATSVIEGLRQAKVLWDPQGFLRELIAAAQQFRWTPALQKKANLYASRQLVGWLEEVHKALQGLLSNDYGRMLNGLHGLTFGLCDVLRVQRGILLTGENSFIDQVLADFASDSQFRHLTEGAFGLGGRFTLEERALFGLKLFCYVVDLLAEALSPGDLEIILFVQKEVVDELSKMRY